ncbi:zinc finger protein 431-like [Centruroides vittatus]|uniref:zinc finger protein 431-like n=1 Tax=Centruroides vittatus TaxID=120091 RepID=UPI0035105260
MSDEEEEVSEEYDIQHNSKAQKHNKCNANKTKFVPSIRKYNKIQGKIKRKYFRVTRSAHSKQNHKCDLCARTFVNKEILQAHLNFHIGKKPFCCTTCNQKFSWQFLLRRHTKEHNTEKQSEIDHTKVGLLSLSKNRKVSKRKPLRCDISDKPHNKKSELEKHNRTHQPVSHCCKICKKEFRTESKLRQHQVSHSEDRPFKCDICNKNFKKKVHLKTHNKTHSDERKYSCQVCNKSVKTERSLTIHKTIHNKDLNYSCHICNKYFKTERYLRRHERTHEHRSDKYLCDVCKKGFKSRFSVDRHRIAKHQNMFVCSYCSKSFKTKNMLKAHRKTHIQKCNICKKELASKHSLNVHQRIHFDIKPFLCEVCNKRFISTSAMKHHQSFHNKDNLCYVCKKDFYDKFHLIRHQSVHKKHLCIHCKDRFKTKAAAINSDGFTINSLLRPPIVSTKFRSLNGEAAQRFQIEMNSLKFIIIDKMSMITARMLYMIERRLREINPEKDEPFGWMADSLSICLVGTLLGHYITFVFYSFEKFIELSNSHRQNSADSSFADVLQHLASGDFSDTELNILTSRNRAYLSRDDLDQFQTVLECEKKLKILSLLKLKSEKIWNFHINDLMSAQVENCTQDSFKSRMDICFECFDDVPIECEMITVPLSFIKVLVFIAGYAVHKL